MLIRSSVVKVMRECPAKAYFAYELGLVRRGEPSIHLSVGRWVHEAIALFHKEGMDAARQYLKEREWNFHHKTKNLQNALSILDAYARTVTYRMEAVERPFEYWHRGYCWRGRVDGLATFNGDLWVVEHKTASEPGFRTKPNPQLPLYMLAMHQEGVVVEGILLNVLDMHNLDVTTQPVLFTQEELIEWENELVITADMYRMCKERDVWPRHGVGCGKWESCPYYVLCTASPSIRQTLVERMFEVSQEALEKSW